MMNAVSKFARMLLPALLIAQLVLASPARSFAQNSSDEPRRSGAAEVILTPAQADSLLAALDIQEVRLRLLQVDLDECRALARLDSVRVEVALDAAHVPWYERAVKHPVVWFSLGVLAAFSAQNLHR